MKIAIFIPAYEAEETLREVVNRIPPTVYEGVTEILIQDDGSQDGTFKIALDLAENYGKVTAMRNDVNLGYGGTKKKAYQYCIARGYDCVVMVHGDGQYAPERLPDMLSPLVSGAAEVVLGSRILGEPIRSGMPVYKWVGNRFLTLLANSVLGLHLTDYHTGYRAYLCSVLSKLDLETCSDGHEISMELLIRATKKGLTITEVPIPTHYGPESRSCSLQTSISYGFNVIEMLINDLFDSMF